MLTLTATDMAADSLKILLIEDDAELRSALRDQLVASGHEVVEAEGVRTGLAAFRARVPDVVLLDHGLEDGDAFDLLRTLPLVDRRVPLLVLTGRGSIDVAVRAMKEGAHDFLTKPVNALELLEKVEQAAAARRGLQAEAALPPPAPETPPTPETPPAPEVPTAAGDLTLRELERREIERALSQEGSRVVAAAQRLGIPRSTLYQKLKEFGIPVPRARRRSGSGEG